MSVRFCCLLNSYQWNLQDSRFDWIKNAATVISNSLVHTLQGRKLPRHFTYHSCAVHPARGTYYFAELQVGD